MPAKNSSSEDDDDARLTRPGQRNGQGSESLLPYLQELLAAKPKEDLPAAEPSQEVKRA